MPARTNRSSGIICGCRTRFTPAEAAGTPIVFIGHVHMPCVFYETAAGTVRELFAFERRPDPAVAAHARYVINVGSVGQPRDGNNATGFVLYDEAAATVTFHRLAYDYPASAAKIRAAGLSPFFADRLALRVLAHDSAAKRTRRNAPARPTRRSGLSRRARTGARGPRR